MLCKMKVAELKFGLKGKLFNVISFGDDLTFSKAFIMKLIFNIYK